MPYWLDDQPVGPGGGPAQPFQDMQIDEFAPAEFAPIEMQPGIGIPTDTMDAVAAAPIFDDRGPVDPYAPQPSDPYVTPEMQPGIGIPADVFTDALPQPTPEDPYGGDPDAISGGVPPEHAQDMRAPADPYAWQGHPLDNPDLSQDQLNEAAAQVATANPIAYAAWQKKRELDAQTAAAAQYLEHSQKQQQRVQNELADYKGAQAATAQKMAELDAQVVDLMSRKVDPNRWWNSRTTGQKISAFIGVFISGLAGGQSGNNSGRNAVLEDLNHTIDQDIAAQKFDIENGQAGVAARRGILAQEFQRTGDMYQAVQAVTISSWGQVQSDLLAKQQLRDPRGTQAAAIGQTVAEVGGKIASARAAAEAADFERRLKQSAESRQWAELKEKQRAAMAAEAAKAAKGGGIGKQKARPIDITKGGFAKREKIENWGEAAESAYQQEVANIRRAQAQWDKTGGRSGGVAVPTGAAGSGAPRTVAPMAAGPQPVTPVGGHAPTAAVEQPKAPAYQSEDDWFENNAPTASPDAKKQFWFVDGDSGNEVPPIKISAIEDPQKFGKRQRIRQQMATKSSQLLVLTERLQKRGFWDKTVNAKVSWKNDEDVQEARALAEDLTGDVLQAKEMGVPSGNDVERVKTMIGRDPAGWQNPIPNLQRARESWQAEQDADWQTNAPGAFKDGRYNRYRVLPTKAPADWIAKVQRRGDIKVVDAEMGNDDPKQLKPKAVEGDAPGLAETAAAKDRQRNVDEANSYLDEAGAQSDLDFEEKAAALVGGKPISRIAETPHQDDFKFEGAPGAKEHFRELRLHHAAAVANLNQYLTKSTKNPDADWKAYKVSRDRVADAVMPIIYLTPEYMKKYLPEIREKGQSVIPRIAGEILRAKGK